MSGQVERDSRGRLLPGSKLSPGRPKGSRTLLSEQFCDDLRAQWEESGEEVLRQLVREDPTTFAKLVCQLVPKNVELDVSQLKVVDISFIGYDEEDFLGPPDECVIDGVLVGESEEI